MRWKRPFPPDPDYPPLSKLPTGRVERSRDTLALTLLDTTGKKASNSIAKEVQLQQHVVRVGREDLPQADRVHQVGLAIEPHRIDPP